MISYMIWKKIKKKIKNKIYLIFLFITTIIINIYNIKSGYSIEIDNIIIY